MTILKTGSSGPLVSFLQLTLKDLRLYTSEIDGLFGPNTLKAVKTFQTNNKLVSDGIVGDNTWQALLKHMSVPTTIPYTYDILILNIQSFMIKYNFLSFGTIGESVMDKDIPYIKFGNGPKQLLCIAGTHANEWICCPLLMKFVEEYAIAYARGGKVFDRFAKDIFNTATIYIIPMLNPDGVDLVTGALNKNSTEYINAKNIANNYPNIKFPDGWKANILGVDLNLQFPAMWEQAKKIKFSQGYTTYAPRDFVGNFPLEAPEAVALYDFTINHNFELMLTYHSQGEVIYWKFLDYNPPNAFEIGKKFETLSGYPLQDTPYDSSFAGFKDWFIQTYNLPGYTMEVGRGTNPLPISQFDTIYKDNIGVLVSSPFLIR